jgi:hypothetical protein
MTIIIFRKETHIHLQGLFSGFAYAIPAQISMWIGSQSKELWHQTVRNLITRISLLPIFPYGGLGSQFEGMLMTKIGKRIENLVTFED